MSEQSRKIALLAGRGELPVIWSQRALEQDFEVCVFPLVEENSSFYAENCQQVFATGPDKLGSLLEILKEQEITRIIMMGKIEKNLLFKDFEPDLTLKSLLAGLPDLSDDSILEAIMDFFEEQGIEVLPQTYLLDDHIPQPGLLTDNEPDSAVNEDMDYAFKIATGIGSLGIGQAAVVKNGVVLAVEAVEGVNRTLQRAAELGGSDLVMAKVCRPEQDLRCDIPTVGPVTMKNLEKTRTTALVVEAGKTIIIRRKEFLERAEEAGIAVAAREREAKES